MLLGISRYASLAYLVTALLAINMPATNRLSHDALIPMYLVSTPYRTRRYRSSAERADRNDTTRTHGTIDIFKKKYKFDLILFFFPFFNARAYCYSCTRAFWDSYREEQRCARITLRPALQLRGACILQVPRRAPQALFSSRRPGSDSSEIPGIQPGIQGRAGVLRKGTRIRHQLNFTEVAATGEARCCWFTLSTGTRSWLEQVFDARHCRHPIELSQLTIEFQQRPTSRTSLYQYNSLAE